VQQQKQQQQQRAGFAQTRLRCVSSCSRSSWRAALLPVALPGAEGRALQSRNLWVLVYEELLLLMRLSCSSESGLFGLIAGSARAETGEFPVHKDPAENQAGQTADDGSDGVGPADTVTGDSGAGPTQGPTPRARAGPAPQPVPARRQQPQSPAPPILPGACPQSRRRCSVSTRS
jgi:hypothetical protein